MNEIISDLIAANLIGLPFISRAAGCISEMRLNDAIFPAAKNVYTNDGEGATCLTGTDYHHLVPSKHETGIAYIEDLGTKAVGGDKRLKRYTCTMDLVCWLNFKLIGTDNLNSTLIQAVFDTIPQSLPQGTTIAGGTLTGASVQAKRPSPFNKYTYNEQERQFLTHPYWYFSIRLIYNVYGVNGCTNLESIIVRESAC